MFQYISAFLSHYPPKRPSFPEDSDKQNCYKQVHALVRSSCLWFCLSHVLVRRFIFSLWESVCHHIAPSSVASYLSVYYTHCPGTTCRSFILHRFLLFWYMELLHFCITTQNLQNKHSCKLCNWFVMVCVWLCERASVCQRVCVCV